jgi:hypothetical protein
MEEITVHVGYKILFNIYNDIVLIVGYSQVIYKGIFIKLSDV